MQVMIFVVMDDVNGGVVYGGGGGRFGGEN